MERKRIYLCLAHMSGQEQRYIQEAFDTNWVVPLGPNVDGFEKELEGYLAPPCPPERGGDGTAEDNPGAERPGTVPAAPTVPGGCAAGVSVVALSSGTAAIHLGLKLAGVGEGDEVIVQSFTFSASCNPVVYLGARPVLVDSEPGTWNMDPALLEAAIKDRMAKTGRKPKAIVPVHMYGMPARMDEITAIADRYGIAIVEDAAEALGARYRGRMCGTLGRYGCLSFNGNKMITTSGGGALVCPTEDDKRRAMFYATQAREAVPYYQHTEIGYNYRMSNICAGIGRGQMTVLDEHLAHHRKVQALYEELLSPAISAGEGTVSVEVHRQPATGGFDSNYWLCTITLGTAEDHPAAKPQGTVTGGFAAGCDAAGCAQSPGAKRPGTVGTESPSAEVLSLMAFLSERGIESRPLWKPMHLQPVFRDAPAYVNGVSERLFRTGLCLPAGPCVSEEDVRYIAECIKEWQAKTDD